MSQPPDATSYVADLNDTRREKDEFFARSPHSPMPREQRGSGFLGLSYFPPDLAYRVAARVEPIEPPEMVRLATSTGEPRAMVRFARLRFQIAGVELALTGFAQPNEYEPDELFIPFQDATSGQATYGAGRYLDVALERDGDATTALLDFNLAYNPYCAYSPSYSCPVPPRENRLSAPINAGERAPEDH
ncbi:MAG TPA: DUF1684 domain-containing protein [Ktedonobacterales bacterium]|jgi:hypothetical protein